MARLRIVEDSDDYKFPASKIAQSLGIPMPGIELRSPLEVVKELTKELRTVNNESNVLLFLAQKERALRIPEILDELYPARIKEHDQRSIIIFEKFLNRMITQQLLSEDGVNYKGKWHAAYKINPNIKSEARHDF